jgi:hypothetical protein
VTEEQKTTYHLAASGHSTCSKFPAKLYAARFGIRGLGSDKIIHGEFDGFLGCNALKGYLERRVEDRKSKSYNQLWSKSTIESKESFITKYLPRTIYAVFVQHLTNYSASLILHAVRS